MNKFFFNAPQETHPERLFALNNAKGTTIYDLGCGTNKTHPSYTGVDVRPVSDITCSIDDLNLPNIYADTIVSRHSLEHVLDPIKTLREWTRILRPDGTMVIVLPDHERINTMDPFYSAGEHLHAYTRESFRNLIGLLDDLTIVKLETVVEGWSFGAVIKKRPMVSILIPHLGRDEGLQKCLASIKRLRYPQRLIEVIVDDGEGTVPEKVKRMYQKCMGNVIIYGSNDIEFTPDSVDNAVKLDSKLVSFNTGDISPDRGNICEHFLVRRSLIAKLENREIFSTDFHHVGCDNWLWAQAEKLHEATRCDEAIIIHHHFSKGAPMDSVYEKGWSRVGQDRATLTTKLSALHDRGTVSEPRDP